MLWISTLTDAQQVILRFENGTKLTGIIYLVDITQTRTLGTTLKNLKVFLELCGKDASKSVVFATTKWEDVKKEVGEQREKELLKTFWKEMLDEGSRTARINNTKESVWSTINMVLEKSEVGRPLRTVPLRLAEKLKNESIRKMGSDIIIPYVVFPCIEFVDYVLTQTL
jgi:hypothetical protein